MLPSFELPSVESLNQLLPAYNFVSLIASGDEEAVYVASQKSLDRHVAVKLYAPHLSELEEFTEGFQKTARQMAKLNHANLIGVFNSGTVEGMHYLVMEFVSGRSLWQSFNGESLDVSKVSELMDGICSGLGHAHENGILHGGLSVSNVLVNQKGEPKIGNFGYLVSVPQGMDSPWKRFVAPELVSVGELTTRCDIYSLGVILYELVTGRHFSPGAISPQVAAGGDKVQAIWEKATAENPLMRYASVEDFRNALMQALPKKRAAAAGGVVKKSPVTAGARRMAPAVGAGAPPAASTAPVIHKVGFNWKLWRNVIIIILLMWAIHLAWNRYNNEKNARERIAANEKALKAKELEQMRAAEAAKMAERKRRWEEQQKGLAEKQPEPEPEPVVVVEKPLEDAYTALDRMQDQLHSGDRSEMPAGAKAIGDDYFMFIGRSMTWPEATWFAEQYGAHLAVPTAEATLEALRSSLIAGAADEIWLGAASNGRDSWVLANGRVWKPGSAPAGEGLYMSINSNDVLRLSGPNAKLPFIIQWHKDGSNPGGLEALLELTRQSIASGSPVYPPGTCVYGVRHYLYVSRPIGWLLADQIAASSGGHLMVATGVAERFNLQRMTEGISAPDGIWIGGVGKAGKWTWVTGENWGEGNWLGDEVPAADGKVAMVQPGDGWVATDPGHMASGFIIEWSSDATE